jgi:hypothetical protein
MTPRNLTAACVIIGLSTVFASASFADGGGGGEDTCYDCPDDPKPKGNNGWGNGIDGENPGTPKGKTSGTKLNQETWDKFEGR